MRFRTKAYECHCYLFDNRKQLFLLEDIELFIFLCFFTIGIQTMLVPGLSSDPKKYETEQVMWFSL